MGRARRPPPALHRHCEGCINRHCHVPVEPSVSCLVISCHLLCGATFHMCKESEHTLLCPLEQVPCLNSEYGCPLSMARHKLAKHLQVCPASVVCCSMEWIRWPNVDSETFLHENIMKETPSEECLDTALALQDQKVLFRSLKMVELFPETRDATEEEPDMNGDTSWEETAGAVGGVDARLAPNSCLLATSRQMMELSQEERDALAKNKEGMDLDKFGKWESMFSKEHAASVLTGSLGKSENKNGDVAGKEQCSSNVRTGDAEGSAERRGPQESQKSQELPATMEMTGLAPWQDGVLERLKTAVDAKDYNMYLVHNGRMLIHFGQMPACTPKERDFVYGNLEAQEVKTVYTFKIPVSYCGKRARLGDAMLKCRPSEHKAVDTSDLGVSVEDLPKSDLIKTTLQCALERELKGHVISESRSIDGLFMDLATQTYNFEPEQFSSETVLADLLGTAQPGGLHVELHSECVTRRHNKSSSAFTFTCNKFFRRDEFPLHFKNVHTDIQSCLDGWFQHRCPLAYLGCTFVQNHFRPPGQKAKVIYSQELKTFAIKPEVAPELSEKWKSDHLSGCDGKSLNSLTSLPLEVLQYIAGFLDSISLSQLSQVSVLMRNICATLLQERGMVLLQWKKKRYSHGGTSWKVHNQIWQFSSLFSKIKSWEFNEVTSMSEHLKTCPFNIVEQKTDPIRLTSMCQPQEKARESLVSTFRARPRGRHF
ncbi:F-box only protein 40 isoform X2 [Mus caroli]|uniref:F-box only protein 40 isoform X2 n=1 Tax=Mus caroli TaxID=10089 RepID=A0A6P5R7U2_MUSCR|nr:F-box only protein 40 isoform X2 [Mus caroli]XP_029326609.1 F-box only protein 40 isoform X2 [Mus caroli]XP_029326610.1 F-box only protein 40 isoform X2 [Mus caroli]